LRVGGSIAVAGGFIAHVVDRLSRRDPRLAFPVLAPDPTSAHRAPLHPPGPLLVLPVIDPLHNEHPNLRVLLDDPHVVVADRRNPWTRRRRLALDDLMDQAWALPPPDAPYGAVVFEAFRASGLGVPRTVVTSTLPVRSALLATGRFLSMVPRVVLHFQPR